ncbi:serine protease 42-like [Melitaea cinxia]|uniref:serine protease 42-like n=1 Tax=Melitaea cinxia TaxID=113334 RepID=UPI001E274D15|nr:serine protease 42-like [Melitaea cinxia]
MKVFGLALLCFAAAVQARSYGVASLSSPAQSGENPWLVHLRLATSTGAGLLRSCVGSIINQSWVITSARCVQDNRFIWIRYGALNVVHPELVTEAGVAAVRAHPSADIALIDLGRILENTDNIAPVTLANEDTALPASGKVCGWGASESGAPGEVLNCFEGSVEEQDGNIVVVSEDGQASQFDLGGPLVSEGVQYGVLSSVSEGQAVYVNVAQYSDWISQITG